MDIELVPPLTISDTALKAAIEAIVVSPEVRQMIRETVQDVIGENYYPKNEIDAMVTERDKKFADVERRVDQKVEQSVDDFKGALDKLGIHIEDRLTLQNTEIKGQIENMGNGFADQITQMTKQHEAALTAIKDQREITQRWNTIMENIQRTTERIVLRVEKQETQIDELQSLHFDVEERGKELARGQVEQGKEISSVKVELAATRNAQVEDVKKIYLKVDDLSQSIEPMRILANQTLKRQENFKKGANIIWNVVISRAGAAALGGSGLAKFVTDHQETIRQFLFGG